MAREVFIDTEINGKAVVRAEGFEGGTCLDATSVFENMFQKQEAPREMVGECAGARDLGERVR